MHVQPRIFLRRIIASVPRLNVKKLIKQGAGQGKVELLMTSEWQKDDKNACAAQNSLYNINIIYVSLTQLLWARAEALHVMVDSVLPLLVLNQ